MGLGKALAHATLTAAKDRGTSDIREDLKRAKDALASAIEPFGKHPLRSRYGQPAIPRLTEPLLYAAAIERALLGEEAKEFLLSLDDDEAVRGLLIEIASDSEHPAQQVALSAFAREYSLHGLRASDEVAKIEAAIEGMLSSEEVPFDGLLFHRIGEDFLVGGARDRWAARLAELSLNDGLSGERREAYADLLAEFADLPLAFRRNRFKLNAEGTVGIWKELSKDDARENLRQRAGYAVELFGRSIPRAERHLRRWLRSRCGIATEVLESAPELEAWWANAREEDPADWLAAALGESSETLDLERALDLLLTSKGERWEWAARWLSLAAPTDWDVPVFPRDHSARYDQHTLEWKRLIRGAEVGTRSLQFATLTLGGFVEEDELSFQGLETIQFGVPFEFRLPLGSAVRPEFTPRSLGTYVGLGDSQHQPGREKIVRGRLDPGLENLELRLGVGGHRDGWSSAGAKLNAGWSAYTSELGPGGVSHAGQVATGWTELKDRTAVRFEVSRLCAEAEVAEPWQLEDWRSALAIELAAHMENYIKSIEAHRLGNRRGGLLPPDEMFAQLHLANYWSLPECRDQLARLRELGFLFSEEHSSGMNELLMRASLAAGDERVLATPSIDSTRTAESAFGPTYWVRLAANQEQASIRQFALDSLRENDVHTDLWSSLEKRYDERGWAVPDWMSELAKGGESSTVIALQGTDLRGAWAMLLGAFGAFATWRLARSARGSSSDLRWALCLVLPCLGTSLFFGGASIEFLFLDVLGLAGLAWATSRLAAHVSGTLAKLSTVAFSIAFVAELVRRTGWSPAGDLMSIALVFGITGLAHLGVALRKRARQPGSSMGWFLVGGGPLLVVGAPIFVTVLGAILSLAFGAAARPLAYFGPFITVVLIVVVVEFTRRKHVAPASREPVLRHLVLPSAWILFCVPLVLANLSRLGSQLSWEAAPNLNVMPWRDLAPAFFVFTTVWLFAVLYEGVMAAHKDYPR